MAKAWIFLRNFLKYPAITGAVGAVLFLYFRAWYWVMSTFVITSDQIQPHDRRVFSFVLSLVVGIVVAIWIIAAGCDTDDEITKMKKEKKR